MSDNEKSLNIQRGNRNPSPMGTASFIGLRGIEPLLQNAILSPNVNLAGPLLNLFGASTLPSAPAAITGLSLIDNNFALSPYRLALFGMSVGASLKHIFWVSYINSEEIKAPFAGLIGAFNAAFNSMNTILFMCSATSPATTRGEGPYSDGFPGMPLLLGGTLFTAGILVETISEIQRKFFKQSEQGKGKPYTVGLFGFARHINYTGYTLWRSGFALAAGGWVWGTITGGLFLFLFANRAIPELDGYCSQRYADMWKDYKAKVPYKLIPYIY